MFATLVNYNSTLELSRHGSGGKSSSEEDNDDDDR